MHGTKKVKKGQKLEVKDYNKKMKLVVPKVQTLEKFTSYLATCPKPYDHLCIRSLGFKTYHIWDFFCCRKPCASSNLFFVRFSPCIERAMRTFTRVLTYSPDKSRE